MTTFIINLNYERQIIPTTINKYKMKTFIINLNYERLINKNKL